MTDQDRELFDRLAVAAGTLATVADNASVILSEQFEEMLRAPIENVRAILAQCEVVNKEWDGEIRETDISLTYYDKNTAGFENGGDGRGVGVKIVHLPTGIGRQSDSKMTQAENYVVAVKALTQAIDKEWGRA